MSRTHTPIRNSVVLAALGSALAFLAVTSASAGPAAATMRVSVSSSGVQADRDTYAVGISASGRYVLLNSQATNLVPNDTNERWDVFVHDRSSGATTRVSVSSSGAQGRATGDPWSGSTAGGISANGRFVVFQSDAPNLVAGDTNHLADVFLRDRRTGRTSRVSVGAHGRQANGASGEAAISADGRFVGFTSSASNLVAHDTNHILDVFVRELATGRTTRVSVRNRAVQASCKAGCESTEAALSANGRYVAFESSATNLVRGDTNGLPDVFVRDRRTGRTERVSVTSAGKQAGADRTNNGSNAPAISADGRYVGFTSLASDLVPGDRNGITDVFVRDLRAGTTTLASLGASGQQGTDSSGVAAVAFSAGGRMLAFSSYASNLVPGDTNSVTDAFVRDFDAASRYLSVRVEGRNR